LPARRAAATVARALGECGMYGENPIIWLISELIWIYIYLLIAQAIISWLLAFGVINRYNRGVAIAGDFLFRITQPALRPIRNFMPNFGGIDISPMILIILLIFVDHVLHYYF
jgi:YggT family protein